MRAPFHLQTWIKNNRDKLKPPVGNCEVFPGSDYIVMVVGGPNNRSDYHINEGPEFFYQIQGDMILRILEEGKPVDIVIGEGDIFVLPKKVPHAPQRFENTVGLVVEQTRRPEEQDGFLWVCENCHQKLYEEYFHLTDIVTQLPPVFDRFFSNPDHTTCRNCATVATKR